MAVEAARPVTAARPAATGSPRFRRLLEALEEDYPGLACELDSEPGSDDGLDEQLLAEPSRVALRRAEQIPTLFDYQRDLVDQICSVCLQSPPSNIGLLALPTGSGKTRTAAVALLKLLSTGGAVYRVMARADARAARSGGCSGRVGLDGLWDSG